MSANIVDRRTPDNLTDVIDDALELAEGCGWRYALAFLISERVPSQIIQRLLSGGGRPRQKPSAGQQSFQSEVYGWKGRNDVAMASLFESLRDRRVATRCAGKPSRFPSRSSALIGDDD